jgi:hypothetical protein
MKHTVGEARLRDSIVIVKKVFHVAIPYIKLIIFLVFTELPLIKFTFIIGIILHN